MTEIIKETAPLLKLKNLILSQDSLAKMQDLDLFIKTTSADFITESRARTLQNMGQKFNSLSPTIFDRVFSLPSPYKYTPSDSDSLDQSEFEKSSLESDFKTWFYQLHGRVENLAQSLFDDSHFPGYTVTSRFGFSDRERIPVHIHRNSSPLDTGNELTLSVALKFLKRDKENPSIRFYPSVKGQTFQRTHEKLIQSPDFLEVPLLQNVQIFLFEAKAIPHTVIFSEDFLMWGVFNGVHTSRFSLDPQFEVGTLGIQNASV